MRIALITPEFPGCGPAFGVGRYVKVLGNALAEQGHTIRTLAATDAGWYRIRPGESPVHCGGLGRSLLLRPLTALPWLTSELKNFHPDIVEIPNWGGLGALLPDVWPLVARLSTSIRRDRPTDPFGAIRFYWERETVTRARAVIADSGAMADESAHLYGRSAETVIPHAIPMIAWGSREVRTREVLCVARNDHRKGVDILKAAWPMVISRHPDAVLHLVGRGHEITTDGGIHGHGPLSMESLDRLRRRCLIQVVPSRFESFGLVVLEAWNAGMPVVATDAGSLREVVGNGGWIVPRENPERLAHAIANALDRPEEVAIRADNGRLLLSTEFAPHKYAGRTLAVYASVLADRPRASTISGATV